MTEATHEQIRDLGAAGPGPSCRQDVVVLESLLVEDFICVGPLGFLLTKEQYLESRRSGDLRHESLNWDDVRVRQYGDAAVAVGSQTQRSTYRERDASGRFRVTQIWVRQGDRWGIVGLHYSPIAQPPEARPPSGPDE